MWNEELILLTKTETQEHWLKIIKEKLAMTAFQNEIL